MSSKKFTTTKSHAANTMKNATKSLQQELKLTPSPTKPDFAERDRERQTGRQTERERERERANTPVPSLIMQMLSFINGGTVDKASLKRLIDYPAGSQCVLVSMQSNAGSQ